MYVFGCTSARDVVRVWMDIDEVVDRQIDPWRLDLFDPNPVEASVEGQPLSFMRLGDVSFAYEEKGGRAVIGMHDGSRPSLLEGIIHDRLTVRRCDDGVFAPVLVVKDLKVMAEDRFAQHFRQYLHRIFASKEALPGWMVSPYGNLWLKGERAEFRSSYFYSDARAMAYRMSCRFTGEMFSSLRFKLSWSEPIQRVLDALLSWSPAVHGKALRDIASGVEPQRVSVLIDHAADDSVVQALRESGLVVPDSVIGSDSYQFESAGVRFCITHSKASTSSALSVGQILVEQADTLVSTRIGLFDLSRSQQRVVSWRRPLLSVQELGDDECVSGIEELDSGDLRLLPSPFLGNNPLPGCHVEPILPRYAECFRYATCLDGKSLGWTVSSWALLGVDCFGETRDTARILELQSGEPERERYGLSPDEMQLLIREAASLVRDETGCLTSRFLGQFLSERLCDDGQLPRPVRERWQSWLLTWLERDCKQALQRRVLVGAYIGRNGYERTVGDLARKYAENAMHIEWRDNPPRTRDSRALVERFLLEVERYSREPTGLDRHSSFGSGEGNLRSNVLRNLLSGGPSFSEATTQWYRDTVPDLISCIEKMLTQRAATDINLMLSGSSGGLDDDSFERSRKEMERNLLLRYGYCRHCCRSLFEEASTNEMLLRF